MRELFLTLLTQRGAYGYELRQSMERQFGDLLPTMNAGQIYTTLARLERDELVTGVDIEDDGRGKRIYQLTEKGRQALAKWIETPVPGTRLKDEFFMKLVLVSGAGLADPQEMLDRQRREYLQSLRALDNTLISKARTTTTELLVEGAILHIKADLDWLDLIEQRMKAGQPT